MIFHIPPHLTMLHIGSRSWRPDWPVPAKNKINLLEKIVARLLPLFCGKGRTPRSLVLRIRQWALSRFQEINGILICGFGHRYCFCLRSNRN